MKNRITALALAGLLLLSGCTSMLERSDVSAVTHVDYSVTEDSSILRVETYQALVSSLLHFVNERADTGTIRLYNYTGDVESDLKDACYEVCHDDPLGAFSVADIGYDSTRILTYYEVDLTFTYSRTEEEVDALREIAGISALRQELARMVDTQASRLTLLVSYFSGSEELIWQLLTLARLGNPAMYCDPGGSFAYEILMYPETGSRRIIEIRVEKWGTAGEKELADNTLALEEAARSLLDANPPAGTSYTVEELANILRSVSGGYDWYGTNLALYTLNGTPATDLGHLLAMEYLCLLCGIEVLPVLGQPDSWLIVATQDGYRHLLPRDLFPIVPEEGAEPAPFPPLPLYTDEALHALGGYSWNSALYPACVSSAPPSEVPEETPEEEPEEEF